MNMTEAELKGLAAELAPFLGEALKTVVGVFEPAAEPIAVPVIDAVDSWVEHLLTGAEPPAAPTVNDAVSRVQNLEKHVAALTIATGKNTTSALADNKLATHAAQTTQEPASAETATADV